MKPDHRDLSVRRQCSLLSLTRSGLYYHPRGESAENLTLMTLTDRQFLETPWHGSRQMARHLQREGHPYGRHTVRRLMRLMGIAPIYQSRRPAKSIQSTAFTRICLRIWPSPNPTRPVREHQLHSDAPGCPVPCGRHGLAQQQGAELAAVEFHGCGLFASKRSRRLGQIWRARDFQYKSAIAIHQHGFHHGVARRHREDIH